MTRWTTGTCKANGINIHYLRTGGDKPPIVLLHGLTMNGACWAPLAQSLETDYDVIMPDARGHGNSSKPEHGYSYDTFADDVLCFIEALGLVSPVLLGHSMGGMTAAVTAFRSPKLLQGLVLADPTFLTPHRQYEVYKSDVAEQHCRILSRPKEDFLAEIKNRRSHRSHEILELIAQARYQTSIQAFEILRPPNPDYVKLIRSIEVPSLLVIGDDGAVVSAKVAAELAQFNRCLEIAKINDAGHGLPFDQPKRFSQVVKAFLSTKLHFFTKI